MFPLIHYSVNKKIFSEPTPLMILGAMWPDLASAATQEDRARGVKLRNQAHAKGGEFYIWCRENAPYALDLARGVASHGLEPHAVDYYADEYWPGCERGWCFALGAKYIPQVAQVTKLPRGYRWWKAHNFVEMAYDLLALAEEPAICDAMVAAVEDEETLCTAAQVFSRYYDLREEKLVALFHRIPFVYAIDHPTPMMLAQRQKKSFAFKPGIRDSKADEGEMAALLVKMAAELSDSYEAFIPCLLEHIAPVLRKL